MSTPRPPVRTFNVAAADQSGGLDIGITELPGLKAENLGLVTWGAAYILANQVSALQEFVVDKNHSQHDRNTQSTNERPRVLEIGAGTALAGLAAALIWKADVTLTDLAPIVPGMAANISINEEQISKNGGFAQCGTLDWASPNRLFVAEPEQVEYQSSDHKFQVILAADTLYSEDHAGLVARTVFHWLATDAKACFMVCYAQRVAYLDHIRELWTLLEEGGLESVKEGLEVGDPSWDEEAPFEWAIFKWNEPTLREQQTKQG